MSAIPKSDTDEMGLGELIEFAESSDVPAYRGWERWLERHFDPAKSALIELLQEHGVVNEDEEDQA